MSSLFNIIAVPLGWVMKIIYEVVKNYGLTIILFTLVTKILMFPLAIKQKKSTIKMAAFQPMIAEIQKKYATDKVKQQEEMARLQQEHGFSMTSGCLPLLIQMPILFGLINVIYNPLTHIAGLSKEIISAATPIAQGIVGTLSTYSPQSDIIKAVQMNPDKFGSVIEPAALEFIQSFKLNFMGMNLTDTPDIKVFSILWIIPVLSIGGMLLQQILTMKFNGQKMEGAMKFMPIYSTLMFGYFSFIIPAGVSFYWIFSSVFGILQELLLRIFFDPDKEKAKIAKEIEEARKAAKSNKNNSKRAAPTADGTMTASQAELAKKRLEKARQMDKEKYGE